LPASASTPASSNIAHRLAAEQSGAASSARALRLGGGESLVVRDVINDTDGSTHVRYDRTFDGLRVIGGDLVTHRDKSARIRSVTWNGPHQVAVASTTPRLSLASAKATGTRKASLAQRSTSATRGELVLYAGGASGKAAPKLAYDVITVGVRPDQTPSRLHTVVDARTGAVLTSWDEVRKDDNGNGIHVGTVTIGTTAGSPSTMRDQAGNYTTDLNHLGDGSGTDIGTVPGATFTDADNVWGDGTVGDPASAGVDAQYGAGKTFDYFKNVLGRKGIWNTGVGARSRVHYGNNYQNAFWDGIQMTYGDGAGNAHPLVEIDIAGHEMTHGVTENTAGLAESGEAAGLNEATSDVFGTSVEWYANNAADTPDYLIGELVDVSGDGKPLRYLDRPSRDGVSEDCWSATVGGLDPHYSAGPLNHWFYLASEGSGSKTLNGVAYDSPTCNSSTVNPVGRDKAARIWYRALTTYLTSGSDYAAAREAAVQSAKDLYGATSAECTNIAASFSAIKVPAGATTCAVTPAPPSGTNLVHNPGFELGDTLWSATANVISQWGGDQPARSGTWGAWLGGFGVTHKDSISQLVTIPATSTASLSYYVHVETDEKTLSVVKDTMTVRAGSTVLQTLSNLNAASGYQLKTVNLSAYVGRTIRLSFSGSENASAATSFAIDDQSVTAGVVRLSDFNRDGGTDLVARDTAGILWLYPGSATGNPAPRRQMGTGWAGMNALVTPGDVTGDGNADLLARDTTGRLWLYPGNGAGRLGVARRIGSGWGGFTITNAADLNSAGRPDLLARDTTGALWLYPLSGNAVFGTRLRIGTGWNGYTILGPGDVSGDGRADIMARDPAGSMWLYRGKGTGGVWPRTLVSSGWRTLTALATQGDWNRSAGNDLMVRDSAGRLWFYPGNNASGFGAKRLIGPSAWQAMTYIG
jgi:Zn-dependent metalloprotease